MDEGELIELADIYSKSGKQEDFGQLLSASWQFVYEESKRFIGIGHNEAEDIASEVALRLNKVFFPGQHTKIEPPSKFPNLLTVMTRNANVNSLRVKKIDRFLGDLHPATLNSISNDPSKNTIEDVFKNEVPKRVKEILDDMKNEQAAQVARRILLDKCTTAEVATELKTSEHSVRRLLRMAKNRLKENSSISNLRKEGKSI